ncbi:MAG: FxLYD domain-containing protein [Paraprevotella sp.]|nr:FxLYD domain-containing protein [Paraprevotella sp.]
MQGDKAELSVLTKINVGEKRAKGLSVKTDVYDADGRQVSTATTRQEEIAEGTSDFVNHLEI